MDYTWSRSAFAGAARTSFAVLRHVMACARDPVGIDFGTNSSSVFGSIDEGETRQEIAS